MRLAEAGPPTPVYALTGKGKVRVAELVTAVIGGVRTSAEFALATQAAR